MYTGNTAVNMGNKWKIGNGREFPVIAYNYIHTG